METYLLDWANLLIRWLHVIAGVAWIGASFYFVMLDMSLSKPKKSSDAERGVFGELWAVHGGGFYQSQKFLTGPVGEPLSDNLHWSKWEAYTTWLSGMGLLIVIYWFAADTYLIDAQVLALTSTQAIMLSAAFIVVSWFIYDALCRWLTGKETILTATIFVFVLLLDWVLFQVFSARAAYIHVGAILGTIMSANVFFHIIPGMKKMIAQIRAGETVNPIFGMIGKQRSVHNTYFTLPVLFIMISNHYPMTYAHPQGWLVLAMIMIAGVLIRQYFVLRHIKKQKIALITIAVALLLTTIVWLRPMPVKMQEGDAVVTIEQVQPIIEQRCVSCHAQSPTQTGYLQPPKGIVLETPEQIQSHANAISKTIQSGYMPIGNLTQMIDDERQQVIGWVAQGAKFLGE